MATIRDVSKLAGVSVATVSRYLNKNGYVNEVTKLKVEQAIRTLQYQPNAIARGLAGKKTRTLALIFPDVTNPFFAELARAVEDVAQMYGYMVILCNSDNREDKEQNYIKVLKQRYVDGILFASYNLRTDDVDALKDENIPLVMLDRAPRVASCTVVSSKHLEGANMAVQHLLDVGCKKIAHIYGPQETVTGRERFIGYEQSVKHFPWYSPSLVEPGFFRLDGGMAAVENLMQRHPDIDGIFAGNDTMAIGALKKLQRMGIKVPDQVALCGFDGIDLTQIVEPEITTIAQPIYDMGMLSTRLLIKKIEGEIQEEQTHLFDVNIIVRGSTERNRHDD
ncbi:LacI family transcriptional regulator [Paenibacillus sp. MZ04-78.2]|uniref:LacI family DNA-binding transcriptional regulator n=1 Tax=Paenibacillus sp. MZ04-78.2 TaxID=2962034 RepID=UPI0020B86649|nr:LacI family DNA-binding transcriptional regulator [Paenibacillus sp. MZ04-78.2]MCP3773800.1 LacI family transcriptional regulator [Paenibacillus sp. MZ04-78.2]